MIILLNILRKEYWKTKLLLVLIWIKCEKITLKWRKNSLGKNDPWTNIGTFVNVVSKNIFKLMTSYDVISMKKKLAQHKVLGVLVFQNFGWRCGSHVGFLIHCFSCRACTFFFIFLA
jgi:hypothetical protein